MPEPELKAAAARFVLGVLPSEDVPRMAGALLDRGAVFPSAIELFGVHDAMRAEVGPLFLRLLHEAGVQVPSKDEAVWLLLRHHLSRIASRTVPPRVGLESIMHEVVDPADLAGQTREILGDSHDAEEFIGAYWGYRDLRERPHEVSFDGLKGEAAVLALDEDVVRNATEWLQAHSA